jgi:hypothetical protein
MSYKMDDALLRLERIHVTSRYMQVWLSFMDEDEIRLHLSRIHEDVGNARQVAESWHEFARMNGVELEPRTRRYVQPALLFLPLALWHWLAGKLRRH